MENQKKHVKSAQFSTSARSALVFLKRFFKYKEVLIHIVAKSVFILGTVWEKLYSDCTQQRINLVFVKFIVIFPDKRLCTLQAGPGIIGPV